jgi:hypothetical protein
MPYHRLLRGRLHTVCRLACGRFFHSHRRRGCTCSPSRICLPEWSIARSNRRVSRPEASLSPSADMSQLAQPSSCLISHPASKYVSKLSQHHHDALCFCRMHITEPCHISCRVLTDPRSPCPLPCLRQRARGKGQSGRPRTNGIRRRETDCIAHICPQAARPQSARDDAVQRAPAGPARGTLPVRRSAGPGIQFLGFAGAGAGPRGTTAARFPSGKPARAVHAASATIEARTLLEVRRQGAKAMGAESSRRRFSRIEDE